MHWTRAHKYLINEFERINKWYTEKKKKTSYLNKTNAYNFYKSSLDPYIIHTNYYKRFYIFHNNLFYQTIVSSYHCKLHLFYYT